MGAWTGKCSNTILEIPRVQASLHNEAVPAFSLERPIFFYRADTFFQYPTYPPVVAPRVPPGDDGARPAGAHGRTGPLPHAVHARRPEAAHGPCAGTRDEPRPRPERGPGAVVRRCGPPPRRPPRAAHAPRARREHDLRPRAAV